ncbi:MAG: hypothetical protein JXB49_32650 [Bacteroidales bacterium]|nr:hypothetical protein [Bacteroidales bacterium]
MLKNVGLLSDNSLLNIHHHNDYPDLKQSTGLNLNDVLEYCHLQSINLIDLNRRKTLSWLAQNELNFETYGFSISEINKYFKVALLDIKSNYRNRYDSGLLFTGAYEDVISNVDILIDNLQYSLYYSILENSPFVSGLFSNLHESSRSHNIGKLIDDFYYLARTKLTDEIMYLPNPQNLTQVFKLRERKELHRFRKILGLWLDELLKGDEFAEKKIRLDLKRANRELRRLEYWKEYSNSPINFTVNSIGGHIPILSNILTAIYTISGLYERWVSKNYNWTMVLK